MENTKKDKTTKEDKGNRFTYDSDIGLSVIKKGEDKSEVNKVKGNKDE